jgi:hypothetical protein
VRLWPRDPTVSTHSSFGAIMARGSDKIRQQLAREQAKLLEQQRKVRAVASRLGNLSRADDTRRKVLAGAFAIDEMKFDPEWGADFMRRFQRFLFRDDDLALFDMPPLPPEEKQRREAALAARRERAAKIKANDAAQDAQASGDTADAPAGEVSQDNAPEAPGVSTSE